MTASDVTIKGNIKTIECRFGKRTEMNVEKDILGLNLKDCTRDHESIDRCVRYIFRLKWIH